MRFLFLVTNLATGGAERSVLKAEAALRRAGHAVTILLMENRVDLPVLQGADVRSLTPQGAHGGFLGRMVLIWRLKTWHRRESRAHPFDLAVSTLPFTDAIAVGARLPRLRLRVANTLGEEISALAGTPDKAARRKARYTALYGRQPCIAVSEGVRTDLVETFGADPANVATVVTPLDVPALVRQADAGDPDIPEGRFLLYAGRFAPQKRLDLLLAAYRRSGVSEPLHLLTPPHPDLLAVIDREGLAGRVHVHGFRANPYPWIRAAAAVLLSSDREGMPNVIPEALALGTPVVSTDCRSGPREILGLRLARWLSPPGDIEAFAERIRAVLADPPPSVPATWRPSANRGSSPGWRRSRLRRRRARNDSAPPALNRLRRSPLPYEPLLRDQGPGSARPHRAPLLPQCGGDRGPYRRDPRYFAPDATRKEIWSALRAAAPDLLLVRQVEGLSAAVTAYGYRHDIPTYAYDQRPLDRRRSLRKIAMDLVRGRPMRRVTPVPGLGRSTPKDRLAVYLPFPVERDAAVP